MGRAAVRITPRVAPRVALRVAFRVAFRVALRAVVLAGALAIAGFGSTACSRPPPDASPEGAVRAFLDEMEAAEDDASGIRRAYDLLGPAARANLDDRARRTSRLQGRQVQPWEMLAAGRFGVAFRPKGMHAKVVGDRASVEVVGADPQSEHAMVLCVHEPAGWRIEPELPLP